MLTRADHWATAAPRPRPRQAQACARVVAGVLLIGMVLVWLIGLTLGATGNAQATTSDTDGLLRWTLLVLAGGGAVVACAALSIGVAFVMALGFKMLAAVGGRVGPELERAVEAVEHARAAHGRLAHADSSTANATEDGGQVSGHEVEAGTESDVTEPIDIMPTPIDIAPAPADAA